MQRIVVASLMVLVAGTSASAEGQAGQQQACEAVAEPWKASRTLASARDVAGAAETLLAPNEAVRLVLHPDGDVAYLTLPKGEGEAASFGGMASFAVAEAGIYRIGLSEPVWVDVVQNGKPAETALFGPGPACSGIRKAVSFALQPGRHVLEISGGTTAEVGVIVDKLPQPLTARDPKLKLS